MSRGAWSLRLARPTDAENMPDIHRAAIAGVAGEFGIAGRQIGTLPDYARLIRRGHSLAAHVDEVMAGFLVAEPYRRELHICNISVVPAFQQRGIGAGLMRAAMIDARNTGFRALTLTTLRNLNGNTPFFTRLGFEKLSESDAHPHLAAEMAYAADGGPPPIGRCAMIRFLG
ncbi:GNAT family N-acetyltransferase [Erythrobacter sp. R86502]|uniref:GNAT family N-acetyltransferase n=1 Tax=Erythrobacter sp. R86502 TaxID=3093846 RepID=UPI0036D2E848